MSAALKDTAMEAADRASINQVVTFKIEGRIFGTPVNTVREIRGWQPATPLPNADPYIVGVLNLRGAIIVVYDLRTRLGLGPTERSRSTVTIVVDAGSRLVGILADAVSDILDINPDELRDPPGDVMNSGGSLLDKLIIKDDLVIALLNINAVVDR